MKILIATATAGGGHLAAASAIEGAWRELRPRDHVEKLDLVQFFSLLQSGAAIKVNRIEEISHKVGQLLDTKKLAAMAKAARAVAHPTAAKNVCEEVLRRLT